MVFNKTRINKVISTNNTFMYLRTFILIHLHTSTCLTDYYSFVMSSSLTSYPILMALYLNKLSKYLNLDMSMRILA